MGALNTNVSFLYLRKTAATISENEIKSFVDVFRHSFNSPRAILKLCIIGASLYSAVITPTLNTLFF